ncbi:MAG: proton-conducting transporter membrane subunit [Vicinamibacterales bacterium]|jgi:hydrogenase-4 component B
MTPFEPTIGPPAVLALRFAVVAVTLLVWRRRAAARRVAFLGSALASLVTGLMAADVLRTGVPVDGVLFVQQASGFSSAYSVDGLAAWFLAVLSIVAAPIAIFSIGYVGHPHLSRRSVFLGVAFNLLVGAVEVVFTAADVLTFLGAWELMTLVTAALVATDHEERASRRAAYLYLVMSHVATGCLIAGFMTLAAASGSLSFSAILSGEATPAPMRHWLFALFFIGFGLKAGIVPLHIWLPEAHPAAPSSISALMSAVLIKTGIYGMVRVCAFGLGVPRLSWGVIVVVVGGLSAVMGVLYALMQHDLKRLLAYHSIENIGIILLGLGAGMIGLSYGRADLAALGIAASLYHVLNHAIFKGLLFLGAGAVVMTTGTRQIEHFGGLLRRMPWTGFFFLVAAMAISGLPPLNGFASEWLAFQALLFGFRGSSEPLIHLLFPVSGALLALTTALAAACFVKAFGISFLALPRSNEAATAHEAPAVMLVPQAWLAAWCVGLGVFPGAVLATIEGVMSSLPGLRPSPGLAPGALGMSSGLESFDHVMPILLGVALFSGLALAALLTSRRGLVARRVPTWGCGGVLTARTEYTATAFSKPLMMIFRGVYRPTRAVDALAEVSPYFPQEVRYRSEIEPTFERFVYGPLVRAVLRVADGMKVLQAGSLHAYLAYVIALVVGLVLTVWWQS